MIAHPSADYQWYRNDEAIPHAVDAEYTIVAANSSDRGIYHCCASNAIGTVCTDSCIVGVREVEVRGHRVALTRNPSTLVAFGVCRVLVYFRRWCYHAMQRDTVEECAFHTSCSAIWWRSVCVCACFRVCPGAVRVRMCSLPSPHRSRDLVC